MVNFSRLNSQSNQPPVVEPRQLFQTLRRAKQFEYLRDVQGDVLGEWYKRRNERDLVIKMNTGSGKTLVGLVLLWSRLKEGAGPALYLCPNRHLASQVRREADSLGITHVDFNANNLFPAEFYSSTGILITTVQKLFNGLSVFKVADRPDPVSVGTILIDDAHTCINIARQQFTARFSKKSRIGERLCALFEPALKQQSLGMYADIARGRRDAYLRVPYWAWQENLSDVVDLFSECYEEDELKFVWPFLKIDQVLNNSIAVISGNAIEIAPNLLPIELVPSFNNSPHRVYMSATLVDDAALTKDFAAGPKSVGNPIKPKVSGDIGERLIISPSLVDSNIEEVTTIKLVSDIRTAHGTNVVVLVPSTNRIAIWKTGDSMEVPSLEIGKVIEQLANSEPNTAILANRYDGIDLPDKACRVLVIDNLPQEHRLASLIEATARQESPFLRKQIAQRIEQGMGRGVRSSADYCVVVLTGRSLVSFMADVKNETFFTEETKRQVELGKELASILKGSTTNAYQAILDLVSQCLDRDQGWQQFHNDRLQDIHTSQSEDTETLPLAFAELNAWQYALKGQYDRAADGISRMIGQHDELSDYDTGWYLQRQAEYLYHIDRGAALEKQLKAQTLNRNLLKPPGGINYRKLQAKQTNQAFAVIEWLHQYNEPNALVAKASVVLEGLSFGVTHERFEDALCGLADIIGFEAHRPDKEVRRGPDVLWRMPDGRYCVIEAKNQVDVDRSLIYRKEAEQLGHHEMWFQQEYPDQECIPVLVHPSATLAKDAYLSMQARIIQPTRLERIVASVRDFVTVLSSKQTDQWTAMDVAQQLAVYKLRPTDFASLWLAKAPERKK